MGGNINTSDPGSLNTEASINVQFSDVPMTLIVEIVQTNISYDIHFVTLLGTVTHVLLASLAAESPVKSEVNINTS